MISLLDLCFENSHFQFIDRVPIPPWRDPAQEVLNKGKEKVA